MSGRFGVPVYIAGAAALTPFGAGWRGLATRVARGTPAGRAVPALDPDAEPCEPRHRKMMSRAAYLAAAVVRAALREPAVAGVGAARQDTGCFFGVGASGGDLGELEAMLHESVVAGALDLPRFGAAGLRAANPLFAFQLMNNFTLCHAAILAGLEGPNAAFYSRGAGTVTALREAAFAVAEGEAALALAGGADSALHPVTAFELMRAGGAAPSEGAAVLALSARPVGEVPVRLERVEVAPGDASLDVRNAVLTHASNGAAGLLALGEVFGETLAAAPALAWVVALDWLATQPRGHVRVLTTGLDGALGIVELTKEPA